MKYEHQSERVAAWVDLLMLPTYITHAPDSNPLFFEKRNIQGSAGNIYPNPFQDRLSNEKEERAWEVIILENETIQVVIMPALGGRIFSGLDKTNGYDFFYRQSVIKPALIGLLGPWISGGLEFNWPQHHRPSTFMPVAYTIERGDDGSKTVWLSENEPMNRMKGMVGICLYPGKAILDFKVQLYNRTADTQSFLWWNNAAVHTHDDYQVVFPPDVHHTFFHARQFVAEYPIARGLFGGIDFAGGTDVSWHKNIPEATSFFAAESRYDFFGGYDHRRDAGVVHVANRHISPGKKFFAWGNDASGRQWQNRLTDRNDPYLELMAGVYSDNQPDFSWLHPFETKSFHQYWFPTKGIGPAKNANQHAAVNLEVDGPRVKIGILAVESFPGATIRLSTDDRALLDQTINLAPGKPLLFILDLRESILPDQLLLRVTGDDGSEIIRYTPEATWDGKLPEPFLPALAPKSINTIEELYLAGLHLEQYRHPHLTPELYWEEAIRRDPDDQRTNNALGRRYLRRADFAKAEAYFGAAIRRAIWRNPNPPDGEPFYNLGLALRFQGRHDEAYDAFHKAVWSHAWGSAGYFALAQLDCRQQDFSKALEHAEQSLQTNVSHIGARNLKTAALRRRGHLAEAEAFARETIRLDCLDSGSRNELVLSLRQQGETKSAEAELVEFMRVMRNDPQNYLDLAFDYANAALYPEARDLLTIMLASAEPIAPMILYCLGFIARQSGDERSAADYDRQAAQQPPDNCFPNRLEEVLVLHEALNANPHDARAAYYLANLLFDRGHTEEAIGLWKKTVMLEPEFATPWRNLGMAACNVRRDLAASLEYYQRAFQANPHDPRILYELDQIRKRLCVNPEHRLAELERHLQVVYLRDDLAIELVMLYSRTGQPEKALRILCGRRFHPWEGGEELINMGWSMAHIHLGRVELDAGRPQKALEYITKAMTLPHVLGETGIEEPHTIGCYFSGLAKEACGDDQSARLFFLQAVGLTNNGQPSGEYYRALALRKLGDEPAARQVLESALKSVHQQMDKTSEPNYFYPISPSALFVGDASQLNRIACVFRAGLAYLGLGQPEEAKAAFAGVLEMDPSHQEAWEEFRRL